MKQYDTQEQIEAFDAYVKQNPAGRQVHHTGTLGYDENEWYAFQEGWNAALAQPAQEPVAWMYQCTADNSTVVLQRRTNWAESGTGLWIETPLYTTPPQRPWVGLTDLEIIKIINSNTSMGLWYMAMEIGAKLKEKNT